MKKITALKIAICILILAIITVMTISMPISYEAKSIRIMTWNTQWFFLDSELPENIRPEDDLDIVDKTQSIARQIVKINPDICCLQEVSSLKNLNILKKTIFQNYGINYYTYIQGAEMGGVQKIAVLSKFDIRNFTQYDNFVRFSVFWKEKEIVFYAVHLKSKRDGAIETDKTRIKAVKEIYTDYEKFKDKQVVILGDFNDNFGSNSMNYLVEKKLINLMYTKKYDGEYKDKYTYVIDKDKPLSIDNVRDLDHIFTNYKMYTEILDIFIDHSLVSLSGDRSLVSDHWPVVAIIQ